MLQVELLDKIFSRVCNSLQKISDCVLHNSNSLQKKSDYAPQTSNSNLELVLGLSGGLDSVVLLNLLTRFLEKKSTVNVDNKNRLLNGVGYKLTAVYIDHQLQIDSKKWSEFTKELCNQYNIPFASFAVDIVKSGSQSLEALARKARYSKFAELIDAQNKVLLTAHHLNDQAETFLLQLVRSAGPRGLSAMPQMKKFAAGYHLRPLLEISRADLENYAKANNLTWVEDTTNAHLKFDRNYLRHQIFPPLCERWPSIITAVATSAKKCAEQQELLDEYLAEDYKTICVSQKNNEVIDLHKLLKFSLIKQRALLSYWLRDNNAGLTERKIIDQILTSCIHSQSDKNPQVVYNSFVVRRHKAKLYLLNSSAAEAMSIKVSTQTNLVKKWDYQLGSVLDLPEKGLRIASYKYCPNTHAHHTHKAIVIPKTTKTHITFRIGGERCRPSGRGGSVSLKKLLQEKEIPSWLRDKTPLFYANDEIAQVVGVKVCEGFQFNNDNSTQEAWIIECEYSHI